MKSTIEDVVSTVESVREALRQVGVPNAQYEAFRTLSLRCLLGFDDPTEFQGMPIHTDELKSHISRVRNLYYFRQDGSVIKEVSAVVYNNGGYYRYREFFRMNRTDLPDQIAVPLYGSATMHTMNVYPKNDYHTTADN